MLKVSAYKKTFSSTPVLAIPSLVLSPAIYWLRGENGTGKTTFLKSVAGLIPFDGEISMNTMSLKKDRRTYTRLVNHAGAEPTYPSFLTGNDLLDFYIKTKGNNARVAQIIAAFEMESYLPNKTSTYSSGMTKKLCLLLAFTGEPKLILLDEPFTTLDVAASKFLQHAILEFYAAGVMFIISSHQPVMVPHSGLLVQNKTIIAD